MPICHAYSDLLGSGGGGFSLSAFLVISCISAPAVKARSPAPVKMTAFIASSDSMSETAWSISLNRTVLMAFSTSGLFNVIVPIPSVLSINRVS